MRSQEKTMQSSAGGQQAIDNINSRKIFRSLSGLASRLMVAKGISKGSRMREAIYNSFAGSSMQILVEETNTLGYGWDSPFLIHLVKSLTEAFKKADINNEKELKKCMKNILVSAYEKLLSHSDQTDQKIQPSESVVGGKRKYDDKSRSDAGRLSAKRSKLEPVQDTLFSKTPKAKARSDSIAKEAQDPSGQNRP